MKKLLLSYFLLCTLALNAAIPTGYYDMAIGKTGAALKTQLSSIISAGYVDKGYDGLYEIYKTSDNLPSGMVWDMYSIKADGTALYFYSHTNSDQCGTYNGEGDCYNREHTFCDSWLGKASPQRSDAHHVVPTDGYVNNRRGDNPHGKVGLATWTSSNGSKLGNSDPSTGYSGTVFEPADQFKGDFARMYFYVATRYESKIAGWVNNGSASEILAGNAYPAYKSWFYNLMIQWNNQDPVSQKEIDRNDAVYDSQKNRNPFIDHPELVNYIWGDLIGQNWTLNSSTSPFLISPSNATVINFGNVPFQQTDTASIFIKGTNLTGDLTLALSGNAAAKFVLPVTTVPQAQATAGYKVILTYNGDVLGVSNAALTISGGGIASVQVNLTATATDDFIALAATNVSATGFTSNWTSSAGATGYSLNVYKLTGTASTTQTIIEEDFNSGLPSGWPVPSSTLYYYDTQTSSTLRMASGSKNCLITTSALNLAQPTVITVKSKQYNNDAGAKLWLIAGTNDTITSFVNSTDYQTFTYNIPAKTSSTTLSFYALANKRVYLDYVKVTTAGTTQTPENVSGYPKSVGNILSYDVNSLNENTTYYYTVTPEGNSTGISSVISVTTSGTSELKNTVNMSAYWYKNDNNLVIKRLPENSRVYLIDPVGKAIANIICTTASDIMIPQLEKGIYIIKIEFDKSVYTGKVSF